ncbi:MAG: tripartite tricarboxylate transporter permease, partial [Angelakisella sp.]|nr:tripartite tricarboxylate transporter permease [Angelakisella sp.]
KGLLSGCLGLIVGCIGLDIQSSAPRYCFGILELQSGVQLVPAMIGLFSLSQVMFSIEDVVKGKATVLDENAKNLTGSALLPWSEFRPLIPTVIQSSIIGILVGILPGAGGDIGSWISYNTAKNASKHPEEFGHGSLVGIAASETANNAVTGGALIPLLTLGIPGSGVAAIMLGGLMIKGLNPGYKLFTDAVTGPVVYCIIIAFAIANILMGVCGLLICKQVVKISTVKMTILAPIIIALSTVGSYAVRQSTFDVYVMLIFGLLGYLMRKYGFATAPVVLAMILGPIAESNFRQTLVITRRTGLFEYFLTRPISIALAILVVVALFSPVLMKIINKKAASADPDVLDDTAHED